jgi:hypothetical protein
LNFSSTFILEFSGSENGIPSKYQYKSTSRTSQTFLIMSKDFRALLSNFQHALGSKRQAVTDATKKSKCLKELTTSLWQRSQLRNSMKVLTKDRRTDHSSSKGNDIQPIHLSICLCIVESLPHADIWKEWMEDTIDPRISASMFIHAKHPERVTHSWTRSKLISISHRPNWNDVRIVKAMLSLIDEALTEQKMTHIIFGTESCLPICPLHQVFVTPGISYLSYYGREGATRFDEHEVWGALSPHIPIDVIRKALPGWCTLARHHAQLIRDMPSQELAGLPLWPAFESCWAPEEAFFPTALSLLGLLTETQCKSLTYAEWTDRPKSRNPEDKAHPREWDEDFNSDLVETLRKDLGCILLRKVRKQISLMHWRRAIKSDLLPKKHKLEDQNDDTSNKKIKFE